MKKTTRKRGHIYKPGRKPRPWLVSPLPVQRSSTYLYARHLALIEALTPLVLEDLQNRMELAKIRGDLDAAGAYFPEHVDLPDILLYALEMTCRRKGIKIEPTVQEWIARKQQEMFEDVLFGRKR